jgi:hypothetical protein
METFLVRLKAYDPRRGHVLRRFTYRGIKFHEERGWYRVDKSVADYLRGVRQRTGDEHSPLAFDVCTEEEAKGLDTREKEAAAARKKAADVIEVSHPRDGALPAVAPAPEPAAGDASEANRPSRAKGNR